MKADPVVIVVRASGRDSFRAALWLLPLLAVAALIGRPSLFAQEKGAAQPPSLSGLQSSYESARLDVTVPFAEELKKLVEGYRAALERLQETLQAEGALEELLEVRKELESLRSTGQPVAAEAKSARLKKLRGIFAQSKQSIVERQAAAVLQLSVTYKAALEDLVRELTKAGKVDEAVKAKQLATAITVSGTEENVGTQPGTEPGSDGASGDMPGAGEIPVTVTARAKNRLTEVPELKAPLVGEDIFSQPDWPLLVTIPKGDFKIDRQIDYERKPGRMLTFSEGSTIRGKGDKPYWNVANSITTGKSLMFEGFNFRGNLSSRLYFEGCSFKDMLLGKGGGWFGGVFMSRWQFRDCAIEGSFTDLWGTRHTGVQMLGCRIERVTFPPLDYQNEDEPSAIALHDEMMILDSYFHGCEIPVSVLSLTEGCVFIDCSFVADPKPPTFAEKVKRTLKVENCQVKYGTLPTNLEFELQELPRR